MLNELPLVIFTIAAQMSAGSFIVLGLINVLGIGVKQETMERVTNPALYAIGPLLMLGFIASATHLGHPLNALNAIRHFPASPLSLEVVVGSAFLGVGALFAVLQWFKLGPARLRQAVAVLAALLGVALVWAISQVYSLSTVPAWATSYTPLRFFLTAFLLGGLAVGAALVIAAGVRAKKGDELEAAGTNLVKRSVRGIAFGAILALGLKSIGLPAYIGYLGTHPSPAASESLHLLTDTYGAFSAAQTILVFAGIALLGYLLYRLSGQADAGSRLLPTIAVASFLLVLAGEVIGRMLFYASMVRVGV